MTQQHTAKYEAPQSTSAVVDPVCGRWIRRVILLAVDLATGFGFWFAVPISP
ncbi:hypothetical protein DIQ79_29550 [Mycolicibacterium smegmatis]|uniref:Uncharacterized protein n=1 Tax=Mycolicibacterium smegmatis (strain ATCC 700084 / mc(2)155) TaxID=246196 RepID=A0QY18_MYCS2|nr:hypothetical protein MSMEG_3502 [Mycolicibacterium smegmatis MC2 155]TBM40822.1 hypothetical protein DIQ86_24975 [Mycolicibacterium smegmatis]TBH28381.1 hypothetical protein EYS45_28980 [Mycolicibacterium smegmatis MC2 155]TBM45438.1 hypothetical protein DIQ85_30050 [Mycolicibacterium smegmatis]TBM55224.1 hypothetical protein DIQ83_29825 [Mycolicibacterium smegmatis]